MALPPKDAVVKRQVRLPMDLAEKLRNVAGYGNVEDLIIECLEEAITPRYRKWLNDKVAREMGEKKAVKGVR